MKYLKAFFHLFVVVFLTALTQIGGVIYLISILVFRKKKRFKYFFFFGIYLACTFFVVPTVAPFFGREKIHNSELIQARSVFYTLANRNYVRPEMNVLLSQISSEVIQKHSNVKIVYLDANFPFFDRFPLLPHLSHNDGKKLDISLVYELDGNLTHQKPSVSGYGVFEGPKPLEYNQIKKCLARGNWQYDMQKYVTLGTLHKGLKFSEKGTKALLQSILKQPTLGKVFIEPHLKYRLGLSHPKIRFHGCQAVRHDDHIHIQLK